jgi:hypothetical protein
MRAVRDCACAADRIRAGQQGFREEHRGPGREAGEDRIGRGGMGLVYRARDTRLDRQVAIKCLRTELFEHHYVERFKREALLLAKLKVITLTLLLVQWKICTNVLNSVEKSDPLFV